MTYPRNQLVSEDAPGTYHCVSRCVRRAFLCGTDSYTGRNFEHRKLWIEDRLRALAEAFAVGLYGYAVMANHVHVVLRIDPRLAFEWTDAEVAARWTRAFPSGDEKGDALRAERLTADADRLPECPKRREAVRGARRHPSWRAAEAQNR